MNVWVFNFEPKAERSDLFRDLFNTVWFCDQDGPDLRHRRWLRFDSNEQCQARQWQADVKQYVLIHVTRLLPRTEAEWRSFVSDYFGPLDDSWCKAAGIVFYSGDPTDLDRLEETLTHHELCNNNGVRVHAKVLNQKLETDPNGAQAQRLVDLGNLVDPDDWDAFDKYELNSKPNAPFQPFVALDILLQGYLAIIASKGDKQAPQKDGQMDNSDAMKLIAPEKLFRNEKNDGEYDASSDTALRNKFWSDECLPDVRDKSWKALCDECQGVSAKTELAKLWNVLRGECCGLNDDGKAKRVAGRYDGLNQNEFTEWFAKAHDEYAELRKEQQLKDFESLREVLNHNLIKNQFLYMLAAGDESSIKKRSAHIFAVWAPDQNAGASDIADKKKNVEAAWAKWPEIKARLTALFDTQLTAHGLALTDEGLALKKEILGENGSLTMRISHFVEAFAEIGEMAEEIQLKRLAEFWDAIDELHQDISKIAMRKDVKDPFGGYISLRKQ